MYFMLVVVIFNLFDFNQSPGTSEKYSSPVY